MRARQIYYYTANIWLIRLKLRVTLDDERSQFGVIFEVKAKNQSKEKCFFKTRLIPISRIWFD